MKTKVKSLQSAVILIGILALIVVVALLIQISSINAPQTKALNTITNALLVVTSSQQASTNAFALDRQEAIKIGLAETKTAINYFFVAAGACLALIIKLLLPDEKETGAGHSRKSIVIGWLAMLACCASLCFGAIGFLYFPRLATQEVFSIYHELGMAVLFQVMFLLAGAVLTGVFVMTLVLAKRDAVRTESASALENI